MTTEKQTIRKYRVGRARDKRIKLTDDERQDIKRRYNNGATKRALARFYHVDRRLIDFIVNPDKYEATLRRRSDEKAHLKYYDSERRKEYIQKHNLYKKQLMEADTEKVDKKSK